MAWMIKYIEEELKPKVNPAEKAELENCSEVNILGLYDHGAR